MRNVQGIGYWVLGIGYWVLGIGYWVLGIEQSHVGCLQGTHPLAMMFVADFAV